MDALVNSPTLRGKAADTLTPALPLRKKGLAALAACIALAAVPVAGLAGGFAFPGLILGWIGAVGALWLPVSIWLMHRMLNTRQVQEAEESALHTRRQIEMFRATRRDALTGLLSRPVFMEKLAGLVAGNRPVALLVIDIAKLGHINNTYGDGTGDDLLRAFADRLRSLAGTRENTARLDGDEFALVLDEPEDTRNIERAIKHVIDNLTKPYPASGILLDVAVTIGIARTPGDGSNGEQLMQGARMALRAAKEAGGGIYRFCGQDDSEEAALRARYRNQLARAIERGEIVPYYQPIVRLANGAVAKFEVLARWNHPELGLLEPASFIPAAEDLGILGPLSMALLRQVAVDAIELPTGFRFAINVSSGQLREFISFVRDQPGDWQRRMDLTRLDVELTEDALTRDRDLARELIDVLHLNGARAGLDNFGTGYANFFHLRQMEFDFIKIGKEFIGELLDDTRAESCVMAMLWLGHGLGIDMVADGVETRAVAERLAKMGCHFAQGFLYSKPMPAKEVADMLRGLMVPQR